MKTIEMWVPITVEMKADLRSSRWYRSASAWWHRRVRRVLIRARFWASGVWDALLGRGCGCEE
jgi:hypothetical protein